ncbi:MAG: hypothetical protein FD175_2732 [Beijerinckiaceae bacterium]|nr:MAG: hypothetical protein FD175_2732 [Beijerinckiaceae bacterium]
MYNSDTPTRAELPTSAQLLKSTILALIAAAFILVAVVLPAEYAIDPTGIGRVLKLTEMGEIKKQLAAEAEADRQKTKAGESTPAEKRSSLGTMLGNLLIGPAAAQERREIAQASRTDETVITVKPGEGVEYKLTMKKGAKVKFVWRAEGGTVNYDMHGTPGTGAKETSYNKGRGVATEEGVLEAAFDGSHGWFWRNRSPGTVTIILKTNGDYSEIKRMV